MIEWQLHSSKPINFDLVTREAYRLKLKMPCIDEFMIMAKVIEIFKEDLGIKIDASVFPALEGQEVKHAMQGMRDRN